jgi:uncharacterized protein (DUF58 family)
MPIILREKGYSVKIFVAEQEEPAHVHVSRDDAQVKALLSPVRLTRNRGFRPQELSEIYRMLKMHETQLLKAYHEIHGY